MNNILQYINDTCYGCGVCALSCGKKIITITQNNNGFYVPQIEEIDKCSNCGLCVNVCSFIKKEKPQTNPIKSYAAWSNNETIRLQCTSGGIGFIIAKHLINEGYKICAVRYNAIKERAEHYIASNIEELIPSIGSKYIQSYTLNGLREIKKSGKYLITGTPCQIDSIRKYLKRTKREQDFILLDFFCHSVPSSLIWKQYLKNIHNTTGNIKTASWRNKKLDWNDFSINDLNNNNKHKGEIINWHNSYFLKIKGEKSNYKSFLSDGDVFFQSFLGNFCINKACSKNCKYKQTSSAADIRIGDFWGNTYANDNKGTNIIIAYTEIGKKIIDNINNCTLIEHTTATVTEGQMKQNAKEAYLSSILYFFLKRGSLSFKKWKMLLFIEKLFKIPARLTRKFL